MFEEYLVVWDWLGILLFQSSLTGIENIYFRVRRFFREWRVRTKTNGIVRGNYLIDDSFIKLSKKTLNLRVVKKGLEFALNNLERIRSISHHFPDDEFQQMLSTTYEKLEKSDEEAERLVNKARVFVRNGKFELALRTFNLALAFVTYGSPYYESIELKRSELMGRMGPKDTSLKSYKDLKKERFSKEHVFQVHGNKSTRIPSAGDCVDIMVDKYDGRYLIVNKPVAAGTTVIVEDPYSCVRFDALKWDMEYCGNCFMKIVSAVFCPGCVFTVYCSEECQQEDMENGHNYECHCLPFLHALKLSPDLHLGLKTICKAGPAALYDIYITARNEKCDNKVLYGVDPKTGRYDSDSYYQILHLVSHEQKEFMNCFAWMAVAIAKILALKTTFFDEIDSGELLGFIEFVAVAYLQHCISFQFNSFSLSDDGHGELTRTSYLSRFETIESRMRNMATRQKVTGIYPLLSVMNHSCYPTAFGEHLKNGKVAVITNRSLMPGEELTFCYGYDFMTCPKTERRSRLAKAYYFQCCCAPCIYSWPTLENIRTLKIHVCPDCSRRLKHVEVAKIQLSFLEKGPENGVMICNRCDRKFDEKEVRESLNYFTHQFVIAKRLIRENQPSEAIPLLAACVEYFQYNICPPALEVFQSQRHLEWAFELVVHRRQ